MVVTVEIHMKDGSKKEIKVNVKDSLKGTRFMQKIDDHVNERADLGDWDRWTI